MKCKCSLITGVMVFAMVAGFGALADAQNIDCAAYQNYAGLEPDGYAEQCLGGIASVGGPQHSDFSPTDTCYAQDIGFVSDNFVSATLNDWPGQSVIATTTNVYWGATFDPTATTMWALEDNTQALGTIDTTTGAFTVANACSDPGGGIWTGLTVDPLTNIWYASNATDLYTVDPTDPTNCSPTLVGPFGTAGGVMIAIAADEAGNLFGHDLGDDTFYSIDKATGTATVIGLTGFDANFAQGMAFDWSDGTCYIWLYQGGGANIFGTVDIATGGVTVLAQDNPLGEFEGAIEVAIPVELQSFTIE